jgi:hypothetical protein
MFTRRCVRICVCLCTHRLRAQVAETIRNVTHVTVAGSHAAWYFQVRGASGRVLVCRYVLYAMRCVSVLWVTHTHSLTAQGDGVRALNPTLSAFRRAATYSFGMRVCVCACVHCSM